MYVEDSKFEKVVLSNNDRRSGINEYLYESNKRAFQFIRPAGEADPDDDFQT